MLLEQENNKTSNDKKINNLTFLGIKNNLD